MKKLSLLLLVVTLITSACSANPNTGSATEVQSGAKVNLTFHSDGRIQVKLEGNEKTLYVDKFMIDKLVTATWVRADGTEWPLRKMLEGSSEPLEGYWVLFPNSDDPGRFDLKVYKDAVMAAQASASASK